MAARKSGRAYTQIICPEFATECKKNPQGPLAQYLRSNV